MHRVLGKSVMVASVSLVVGMGCGSSHGTPRAAQAPRTGTSRAALTTTEVSTTTTTSASVGNAAAQSPGMNAPVVTRATPIAPSSAVMRLTTARCDREAACSHVGIGRTFGDRDACVNEIGHAVVATLSADDCPVGIEPDRLDACASEVQAASCEDAGGAKDGALGVEHLASCSRERLCGGAF